MLNQATVGPTSVTHSRTNSSFGFLEFKRLHNPLLLAERCQFALGLYYVKSNDVTRVYIIPWISVEGLRLGEFSLYIPMANISNQFL